MSLTLEEVNLHDYYSIVLPIGEFYLGKMTQSAGINQDTSYQFDCTNNKGFFGKKHKGLNKLLTHYLEWYSQLYGFMDNDNNFTHTANCDSINLSDSDKTNNALIGRASEILDFFCGKDYKIFNTRNEQFKCDDEYTNKLSQYLAGVGSVSVQKGRNKYFNFKRPTTFNQNDINNASIKMYGFKLDFEQRELTDAEFNERNSSDNDTLTSQVSQSQYGGRKSRKQRNLKRNKSRKVKKSRKTRKIRKSMK